MKFAKKVLDLKKNYDKLVLDVEPVNNTLTEEAYKLSHSNRAASDAKTKEANDILDKIKALEAQENSD